MNKIAEAIMWGLTVISILLFIIGGIISLITQDWIPFAICCLIGSIFTGGSGAGKIIYDDTTLR